MLIDRDVAVLVCAGPSLDLLSPVAWEEIGKAGAMVAIGGSLAAEACLAHRVAFTYAAAMDASKGSIGTAWEEVVPGFEALWAETQAWRITIEAPDPPEAESYVRKALDGWSDDPNEGYAGGSKGMVIGNWLCNDWARRAEEDAERERVAARSGKRIPRRRFQKLAYVGLDMVFGKGGHARGAGLHQSGFSLEPDRDRRVRRAWGRFYEGAVTRGVEVVNLSPGTGLEELPHPPVPTRWLNRV